MSVRDFLGPGPKATSQWRPLEEHAAEARCPVQEDHTMTSSGLCRGGERSSFAWLKAVLIQELNYE